MLPKMHSLKKKLRTATKDLRNNKFVDSDGLMINLLAGHLNLRKEVIYLLINKVWVKEK